MPEQPQTQILSVRISDSLRNKLEHFRDFTSRRKREAVSTSEVAKQLLESARVDRLEVGELLREPTETLLRCRKKYEANQPLSRAEWTALAYYVQQGEESFTKHPISPESTIAILEAFQAVYKLRKKGESEHDSYYLGNLPGSREEDERKESGEAVRRAVAETVRRIAADAKTGWMPTMAGRNLYLFLDDEEMSGGQEALNQALRPCWPGLWRVAARAHYLKQKRPIRAQGRKQDNIYRPTIPTIHEGKYSLSFARSEGDDFHLLVCFDEQRRMMYPMGPYPRMAEFRALLAAFDPKKPPARGWDGEYFFAYVAESGKEIEYWFRAHDNGVTIGFTMEEWSTLRKLFRRAWEMPEVIVSWDALMLEYGEL